MAKLVIQTNPEALASLAQSQLMGYVHSFRASGFVIGAGRWDMVTRFDTYQEAVDVLQDLDVKFVRFWDLMICEEK